MSNRRALIWLIFGCWCAVISGSYLRKISWLRLVVCDVGQGDAILLTRGYTQILIDGGPDTRVVTCLQQHLPLFDRHLELVIGTHADQDHIGGLPTVFKYYHVEKLLTPAWGRSTQAYRTFLRAAHLEMQQGMQYYPPQRGRTWEFGDDLKLTEISPEVAWGDPNLFSTTITETLLSDILEVQTADKRATNDGSIGTLVNYGDWSVLLTGDMEVAAETAALNAGLIPDVNAIKVGHHGAKTSSTPAFIKAAHPEMAIISAGRRNRYGHPHSRVMTLLKMAGCRVLQTSVLGTVQIATDGQRYWVMGESIWELGVLSRLRHLKLLGANQ